MDLLSHSQKENACIGIFILTLSVVLRLTDYIYSIFNNQLNAHFI
jgi:hypothetical protein